MSIQKTFVAKPREINHDWILIDAQDIILGRLASLVANRLRGKHKSIYGDPVSRFRTNNSREFHKELKIHSDKKIFESERLKPL